MGGSDSRISSVRAYELTVPLPAPVRNGTASITERHYLMVDIESDEGLEGSACVFTRGAPLLAIVRNFIAPQLIGRPVLDIPEIWADVYRSGELFLGRSGAFPRALSAVDIALWDLKGKSLDQSIAEMLGMSRDRIPVLMALGYYQSGDELGLLEAEYSDLCDAGFRRFKMMAGGASLERDMQRIGAIARVLPADASLAVDVNGAWSDAAEALAFIEACPIPIDFIEDPFRPDNLRALRELRTRSAVPIAIGEWESGRSRFSELVEQDLVDILRIDATAVGGISEWLQVADLARQHGTRVLPHYYPEIHIQLALATPLVEAIEVVPTITGADNFTLLTIATPWEERPESALRPGAGLGVMWDRSSIGSYLVERDSPAKALA